MKKRFLIWDNPKDAIISLTLLLMLVGCINVFSASFVEARDMFEDGYYYLKRYLIFGAAGLMLMLWLGFRAPSYKTWLNDFWLKAIYFGVGSLLLLVDLIGTTNKGAQRWLYVGGISIQPSELAKIAVILLGAALLGEMLRKRQSISLLNKDTVWPFVGTVIYGILVLKQPDMGTAAIIVALMVGLYILAGLRLREVVGLLGILGAVAVAGAIMAPYRLQRVKVWLDPWSDEANTGYQMVQSLMSIGSGGLTGLPWGQGSGKFFYLPEAHTDFAFAIFCQEWGLLGAAILISVFLLLAAVFFRIAMNTKDERGFILVSGVSLLIVGQAVANMAMVCGLLPVIGVPLSFISYGGTSMLITLASIGLVLSVYRDECKREKLELGFRAPSYKTWLNDFWLKAIYFGVGSLLLLVDLIGTTNKGAQRWLYVGGISIQPSELAKIAVILLGAALLGEMLRKRQSISLLNKDTVWPFVGTVIYGILVLKQPDMGTAAIIVALMVGLYILAGLRLREVVGLLGILGAVAVAGAIMAPYRLQRVKVWLDPWSDEANTGYQMVQSLMSIGSGGLTGLPWGQGSGKFFYLPEAHTDFAFAIFCQEWGLLGAAILISVFLLLAAVFFRIAMNTKDERGFILVSGVSLLIVGQAVANMAMVCGLLPVIGVPLSFISYGGTSMLITLASIGLVLSVYRDECKREKLERLSPDTRRTQMRVVSPAEGRWQR